MKFLETLRLKIPTRDVLTPIIEKTDFPESVEVRFGYDERIPSLLIHAFDRKHLSVAQTVCETEKSTAEVNMGEHNTQIFIDYMDAFRSALGNVQKNSAILEIGAGEGLVVSQLLKQGFTHLTACDGPTFTHHSAIKDKVRFLYEYFRPGLFAANAFDIIYSKTAFEHIPGVSELFAELMHVLKPGGTLFFSVPCCDDEIALGDLHMPALTHWNYFTTTNLKHTLQLAGFENIKLTFTTGEKHTVYACATKPANSILRAPDRIEDNAIKTYSEKIKQNTLTLQNRINAVTAKRRRIGIYGTDFNLATMLNWGDSNPILFDSDPTKWGMYFQNKKDAVIHSPKEILGLNLSEIWIAPIHYDTPIRKTLETILGSSSTQIVSLKDTYERQAKLATS